ncbi:MAG TPA: hypothetical protein VJT73_08230 [Polyangiaceae bacterium]|nr:hypothetical protein [Polyangiaceae bacterium]
MADGAPDGSVRGDAEAIRELSCVETSPCPHVELTATAAWTGTQFSDDGVRCLLTVLRDARAEQVEQLNYGYNLGMDSPAHENLVVGGRGARASLRQPWGYRNGEGSYREPIQACVLREASYFQACLDMPNLDCLRADQWFASCASSPNAACP